MKKHIPYYLFSTILLFLVHFSTAQSEQAGRWEGTIDVRGNKLDLSIELENKDKTWTGKLDIPIQNIKQMKLDDLVITKDSITFRLSEVPGNASYKGKFSEDYEEVNGTFTQGGGALPLLLNKRDISIDPAKLVTYTNLVDSLMEELKVAGAGIGIIKGGKVIFAEGFGYRDYENKVKADANTIFAIGSSSKAFTTMGLGMLVDEGKLEWDKAVIEYMPDFKLMDDFATQEATAIDLITHQSGLPRHNLMWYATDFSREELFSRLQYLEPNKSFRSTWQYQNLMYMTAGILIERITEQSWEDFTEEKIFKPLGMKRSNFSVERTQKEENYALPYQLKEDAIKKMDFHQFYAIGPAGSINSSVEDMLKWVQFHLNLGKHEGKELIGAAEVSKMHSPHKTITASGSGDANFGPYSYGLGWMISNYGDTYFVQHGGNIDGFSALVVLLPKDDIGMVLLSNQNGSRLPGLAARYALDLLLDKKNPVDWYKPKEEKEEDEKEDEEEDDVKRIEGTKVQHADEDYVGVYEDAGYGEIIISKKGDQLYAKYYKFEMPLEHWHYETFQGKLEELEIEMQLTFQTDKNGNVVSLSTTMETFTEDILFKKLPPDFLSDAAFLEALTGDYDLGEMIVKIGLKAKTLTATLPGQPVYTLLPKEGTTFDLKGLNGFTVEFILDENKAPEALVFHQPNGNFKATRVKD